MNTNPHLKPSLSVQIGPYAATLYIHRDERGVAWIDNSNVKVVEVIVDHVQGHSPQEIHEAQSHLSLAQIYSAIAFYYDYKQEVDNLIQEWDETYSKAYALPENVEWREKMRVRASTMNGVSKEEVAA